MFNSDLLKINISLKLNGQIFYLKNFTSTLKITHVMGIHFFLPPACQQSHINSPQGKFPSFHYMYTKIGASQVALVVKNPLQYSCLEKPLDRGV